MKILAHVHTFNDSDVIDRCLQALREQTRRLAEIVVVDNASTDGTVERVSSSGVTLLRHAENLGTSGAVISGFRHALHHGYDWIWLFDADSAPVPDALDQLLALYHRVPAACRERAWFLATRHLERAPGDAEATHWPIYATSFTATGHRQASFPSGRDWCEVDATIWSGTLYHLPAVRRIGLPDADYVLDWGEYEYGYRGMRQGYRGLLHRDSVVRHNIGGPPGLSHTRYQLGPITLRLKEFSPIRCYYLTRNVLHFWLHVYHRRSLRTALPCLANITKFSLHFLLRPITHRRQVVACLRGIRDGLTGRLDRRF